MPPGFLHWDTPPPMQAYEGLSEHDLTGNKFGRFTVVGLLDLKGGKNRGRRWVCRCACGDYEPRSPDAIRRAVAGLATVDGANHRCWNCAQLQVVQGRYSKRGGKPLSDFINPQEKKIEAEERSPEEIIISRLRELPEHLREAVARDIVSKLMKYGYRILRAPQ